jgi:GTPase SAR1 family protein
VPACAAGMPESPPAAPPAARAVKLCLLGAPGVGKSSLAQRLLHDRFPPDSTGPGIHVGAGELMLASGIRQPFTLWDVAAASAVDTLSQAYLSRADAVVVVAPGDDGPELQRALMLIAQARRLHPRLVAALMINRAERVPDAGLPAGLPPDLVVARVSARAGDGVRDAFAAVLQRIAATR